MVTIKEIAERVGTSPSTVSNVLNCQPGTVSQAVREQVLSAVREMGYRPNRQARQLRKQTNLTIAVQISSSILHDDHWRPTVALTLLTLQGISDYICSRGYRLHLILPEGGQDLQEIERQVTDEDSVAGMICMGQMELDDGRLASLFSRLRQCGIPAVSMDSSLRKFGLPCVDIDLEPGIRAAAARIAELGHRQLGYIGVTGLDVLSDRPSRLSSYSSALAACGLELPEDRIFHAPTELETYGATMKLLDGPICPTCIIYSSDHLAVAGLAALRERGLRVPEDISITGIDNASYVRVIPLATIDQFYHLQGESLAALLLERIARPQRPVPPVTFIPATFVERHSLAVAAGG